MLYIYFSFKILKKVFFFLVLIIVLTNNMFINKRIYKTNFYKSFFLIIKYKYNLFNSIKKFLNKNFLNKINKNITTLQVPDLQGYLSFFSLPEKLLITQLTNNK